MTGRVLTRPDLGRLTRSTDVRRVLRRGRSRGGHLLVLRHLARPDGTDPDAPAVRLAVVASRAVGGAVQRNRAKRLLREAARAQVWRPGHDVVLVARAACAASDLREVSEELRRLGSALDVLEPGLEADLEPSLDRDEGPTP